MSDQGQENESGEVVDLLAAIRQKKQDRVDEMRKQSEEKSSGLPPLDEVREQNTMRIYTINTERFERKIVETALIATNPNKTHKQRPVTATLITLKDDRVKEYMPSKVWSDAGVWTDKEDARRPTNFNVLFYVNTSMPQSVRPFKDNTYLMFFVPESDDVIEYDVNLRIFMDQVPVVGLGMTYVIMFGDETYKELIVKEL